ncbi:hypothetical protein D1115_06480 [Vibrio alfacsensis]|uniref:Uncharacterized protein n=1 Tax=Vibrio alfacsensis TaxID=1074311 RepID=A0ABM6YTT2_9VIBR|nr:hypothetical protein [Vibrio alfacsensis]AXY00925.1 hypothetical protein D1115_06480 [Vibrio alfacsensis]
MVEINETQLSITNEKAEADKKPVAKQPLILWCLSDCEIINQQGLPTFTPQLADLALGGELGELSGRLNTEKSFIRTTSVSRFNQARAGIDSEQVLIAKGSVLVFDDVPMTPQQLELLENKGIGINRQQGLGWVKVNPAWAFETQLSSQLFPSLMFDTQSDKKVLKPANSPLTRWLDEKLSAEQSNQGVNKDVMCLIEAILQAYTKLRSYNHISIRQNAGPSHAQWGRVREAVKSDKHNWQAKLFDKHNVKTSKAICKSVNDEFGWGICWYEEQGEVNFTEFSQALFKDATNQTMMLAIEKLSRYELCNQRELARAKSELLGEKA